MAEHLDSRDQDVIKRLVQDPDLDLIIKGAKRYWEIQQMEATSPATGPSTQPPEPATKSKFTRRQFLRGAGAIALTAFLSSDISQFSQTISHPIPVKSNEAASTPEKPVNLFDELFKPFIEEARKKRAERAKNDPEYSKRIDQNLNKDRVNFVLFGYGETSEPPATEKATIGSQTILSYNYTTRDIALITLTHDIRTPEIERYQAAKGIKAPPTKIDQAYPVGGFGLMRQTIEDATGLVVDFQLTMKDVVIKNTVDEVFGTIAVDIPFDLTTSPFYLDGVKYGEHSFKQGPQKMDGTQIIQFTKALAKTEAYDKRLERSIRKNIVLEAIMSSLKSAPKDPLFWGKLAIFLNKEVIKGNISNDFDTKALLLNQLLNLPNILRRTDNNAAGETVVPKIEQTVYVVDAMSGDGGVQWVTASENPVMKDDLQKHVYVDKAMAVPIDANPYARDLVKEYWPSVRKLIREKLS
ncbi:MAG: LCP family protein [Patescibacteria group bacterium]|nr:LCP family protein [Patescibacteria group bacterium]